jgi:hypothetical protein
MVPERRKRVQAEKRIKPKMSRIIEIVKPIGAVTVAIVNISQITPPRSSIPPITIISKASGARKLG